MESDAIRHILEKDHPGLLVCGGWPGAEGAEAGRLIRTLLQEPKEGKGWMAFKYNSSGAGEKWRKITRKW